VKNSEFHRPFQPTDDLVQPRGDSTSPSSPHAETRLTRNSARWKLNLHAAEAGGVMSSPMWYGVRLELNLHAAEAGGVAQAQWYPSQRRGLINIYE